MSSGATARLREVMVAVQEYHLKILAPRKTDEVLQGLVSHHPHPRVHAGDRVENMVLDRTKFDKEPPALVVTCVHHSLDMHFGKTILTTLLETDVRRFE